MTILWGREHPGRRRKPAPRDEPCLPCAQKRGDVRQFSLNPPPELAVVDRDVPVIAPGVSEELDPDGDGIVVRGPGPEDRHVLNPSAALIWASIDGRSSTARIADELHAELGVDREMLERDVRATITRLRAAGLVTLTRPA